MLGQYFASPNINSNRVFYRTDVTFDEHNFRLSPAEEERHVMETPTVEVDVYSSGRRAGQPAPEMPVAVPDQVSARLRVMPEMVAIPNEPQPELAAVHSRPTCMKKFYLEYPLAPDDLPSRR